MSAADNDKPDSNWQQIKKTSDRVGVTSDNTTISEIKPFSRRKETINSSMEGSDKILSKSRSGCCSVLVHYQPGWDVFAYRRDSSYAATLYFEKVNWYGKEALKEYKLVNGYFFHTIISKNGWCVGTGGPDVPWINREMEKIGGQISLKGQITSPDLNRAYGLLKKLGMGHFIIKSPDDYVGVAIYYYGKSRLNIFKMKEGEYVSVPNSPAYYRRGTISSTAQPVSAALWLAATDKWGINRRNIITYEVLNSLESTDIRVWASYDNGKLVNRVSRGYPDNLVFRGTKISAKSIPTILNKKYIGEVSFKKSIPLAPQNISTST